jgi:hypothetical protein
MRGEKNRLGGAELHSQSQTELSLLSLRADAARLYRIHSCLRVISCGLKRKMYHLSPDQKLSTKSTSLSLSGEPHQTRLEPKNTPRFWNHSKKLFRRRATPIQGFLDERNNRVITETDAMIEHARRYQSEDFREKENLSQNQDVAEFKKRLDAKLYELPSKPFMFSINDLHRSIRRLKTKTSSGHEKVSNKLLKSISISHYGFILQTFNALLIEKTYPQH